MKHWTVDDIKTACAMNGSHFFDRDTMRFFRSRVLGDVYQGPGGIYFVTSEKYGDASPRKYTVRCFLPGDNCRIATVGPFCELSKYVAQRVAREHAATPDPGATE